MIEKGNKIIPGESCPESKTKTIREANVKIVIKNHRIIGEASLEAKPMIRIDLNVLCVVLKNIRLNALIEKNIYSLIMRK
ncbi:hypothetical protein BDFB_000306 [Asbolus verrucosus]|uniref:Uncharacterized protein n=1 Tax=Asbolus verrucosus TaxID=1661398 RepID=A0A482VWR8_ASBVE|nr:hypothetical protein BDFB_000306 [Asbolus verrucosus]